jgi:hypothetical protein
MFGIIILTERKITLDIIIIVWYIMFRNKTNSKLGGIKMSKVIIMVGLPMSGKSQWVKNNIQGKMKVTSIEKEIVILT